MTPQFLRELWAILSPKIRRGLLTVAGIALVLILVMFAFLFWYTGEVHKRFGVLPTTKDLKEQTDHIADNMATKGDVSEIGQALYAYQDSLGRLRRSVDSTLIAPGLIAIVDLQRRMAKLESGQVATRIAIEEQKQLGHQSTVALIAQMNRQSSAEQRAKDQQQRREQEERELDRAAMRAIMKKLKIADPYDTR